MYSNCGLPRQKSFESVVSGETTLPTLSEYSTYTALNEVPQSSRYPEDGGSMLIRNSDTHLPNYTLL
jgi:hypothetical protein